MSENRSQISRRRVLVGAGAGAAAVWAAPAISTLASAQAATTSRCSVFRFVTASLTSPAGPHTGASTALTGTFTAGDSLTVGSGNVDLVGPGTDWPPPTYTPTLAMDLTGTGNFSVVTLNGPNLANKAYTVEVEVYGALDHNNTYSVTIGGTPFVTVPSPGYQGPTISHVDSGAGTAGGALVLTHTSGGNDNQGMFLARLEVFLTDCA
jgi:hypothetical protein